MDTLSMVVQQILNGTQSGIGYAVVGLGLALIIGVARVLNFCHGEFFMLGAYMAWIVTAKFGWNYLISIPVAVLLSGVFAYLASYVTIYPLLDKEHEAQLMATLALGMTMTNVTQITVGQSYKNVVSPLEATVLRFGSFFVTEQKLLLLGVGLAAIVLFWVGMKKLRIGKMMLASAQNYTGATLVGIDVKRVKILAFAIGSAAGGLAGVLMAPSITLYPGGGFMLLFKGFVVTIIAGMGSFIGCILGGLLLGISEALFAGFVSASYSDACSYVVVIIFMLFRPQGIFGKGARRLI